MAKESITVTLDAQAASDFLATVEQESNVDGRGGEACDEVEKAIAAAGWDRERFSGVLVMRTGA